MNDVLITTILTTYNHEKYVGQCIKSLLNQTLVENLEIIWVDDCSTDETILKGEEVFDQMNFNRVKRLHYKNNRHQKRIPNRLDVYELICSDFFTMIDGDDYLVRSDKFEFQLDIMRANKNIGISFTKCQEVNEAGTLTGRVWGNLGDELGLLSFAMVIEGDGGLMPTSSIMLSKDKFSNAPDWFWEYQPVGDYMYQVIASDSDGALFIPIETSAYRFGSPQSWTQQVLANSASTIKFHGEFIELLIKMQDYYGKQYAPNFNNLIDKHLASLIRVFNSSESRVSLNKILLSTPAAYNVYLKNS